MTGDELLRKILNKEIRSGAVINCIHGGSIPYEKKVYFNGNWFSAEPYEPGVKRYDDIILHLCDPYVTYEIINERIKNLKPGKVYKNMEERVEYLECKVVELIDVVNSMSGYHEE